MDLLASEAPRGLTKVVGYFAYIKNEAFCDGDACVIAGTAKRLRRYLAESVCQPDLFEPEHRDHYLIKKTRFGEVFAGLLEGAAYAFDAVSYRLFYEWMRKNHLNETLPDYRQFPIRAVESSMEFIRIQWFL